MPCTTILAGKNATYDGSTMIARNDDAGGNDHFTPKKMIVVQSKEQPRVYKAVLSSVEIPLPENPLRYTAMPNAVEGKGIWGACGVNEARTGMTATETITSNPRVLGADPLVENGIGEEDIVSLVLPYIHNAREGVQRLGELLETYGTYEMNGIAFSDQNEMMEKGRNDMLFSLVQDGTLSLEIAATKAEMPVEKFAKAMKEAGYFIRELP